jgi:hypothetical protein
MSEDEFGNAHINERPRQNRTLAHMSSATRLLALPALKCPKASVTLSIEKCSVCGEILCCAAHSSMSAIVEGEPEGVPDRLLRAMIKSKARERG